MDKVSSNMLEETDTLDSLKMIKCKEQESGMTSRISLRDREHGLIIKDTLGLVRDSSIMCLDTENRIVQLHSSRENLLLLERDCIEEADGRMETLMLQK
jgi:hypothetical protein